MLRLFSTCPELLCNAMPDQFEVFDIAFERRARRWAWRVCTREETTVMSGRETSRAAARYKAARALFLMLLSAPYRSARSKVSEERLNEQNNRPTNPSDQGWLIATNSKRRIPCRRTHDGRAPFIGS